MRAVRTHTGRRRWMLATAAVLASSVALAGCSGGDNSTSAAKKTSINYALPANFTPNWILPIGTSAHLNTNNVSIAESLWEPLIEYDGSTGKMEWNKKGSIATAANFASDGKSVTITLGKRSWSDGKPITSRDVEFWYNIITANKKQWANYNAGKAPDNWTKFSTIDAHHFKLTFDKKYNDQWMLANELSMIVPLPQHAWDKTSSSAKVSNADRTTAGAQKVWKFLLGQAKKISSYASNPLWNVVSGPYKVKTFSTSGKVDLTANTKYDGGEKAGIKTVHLLSFTTADAEKNALRSGGVDYGYIGPGDLDQKASFTAKGYKVKPWSGWAITYMPYNFNNPQLGAVFKQLYARQAVQMSINQPQLTKVIFNGTAVPTYGPIPQAEESDFVSKVQQNNPYPFSTSKAAKLLTSHGWTKKDGVMTCTDAGTGSSQCGAGIDKGTKFEMHVLSQSGSSVTTNMMSAIKSSLSKTGIGFNIKSAPVNSVLSQTPQCTKKQSICKWQLSFFGTAGSWYFPAYATGDSLFQTGGGSNFGNYSNPKVDKLINNSTTSSSASVMKKYSAALAKDLPVVWLPEPDYQVSVMKKGLTGFSQDPLANFHPAQWKWSK
ncbi:peptide ABC transporter substrate-binding protein [Spelaeicoccus albus]|uniref:Peptide/nickel transport system substrate-binding protein n=1 Tax=Spelaeicoccus albus TaxID=1280376 RepID=A0A7Z0A9W3_9MICO|nr:peptide ABC transporter substrate-binding protein [Spelaeicoccus albus]NYI67079.1 peptide/nickel transport system substrate-binding protein [Spelaeicoccus albus]